MTQIDFVIKGHIHVAREPQAQYLALHGPLSTASVFFPKGKNK